MIVTLGGFDYSKQCIYCGQIIEDEVEHFTPKHGYMFTALNLPENTEYYIYCSDACMDEAQYDLEKVSLITGASIK